MPDHTNEEKVPYEPQPGKPLRNLIFYIFHPMRMINEKPGLFLAVLAPAVYFLGVTLGWGDNFVGELLNKD